MSRNAAHEIAPVTEGVWTVADLESPRSFTWEIGDREISELEAFNARMSRCGKSLNEVEADDFDCPVLSARLQRLFAELESGRGIVIFSGFPVGRWDLGDSERAFWGMGTRLGTGISQSVLGDRLGHVMDVTKVENDPHARAYRSNRELYPHTDGADIVGLFCLRGAESGGVSLFTNALALHNQLLESEPEVLRQLYQGFHFHRHGEEAPGEEEFTADPVPVFSSEDGVVSTTWNKLYMELGQIAHNQGPLTERQVHAFRTFLEAANSDELQLRFVLQPGQIIWFNNLTHYHSRTGFVDRDDPSERRHLLRLWLENPALRPKSTALRAYDGSATTGIEQRAGKRPSFDFAAVYKRFGTQPV